MPKWQKKISSPKLASFLRKINLKMAIFWRAFSQKPVFWFSWNSKLKLLWVHILTPQELRLAFRLIWSEEEILSKKLQKSRNFFLWPNKSKSQSELLGGENMDPWELKFWISWKSKYRFLRKWSSKNCHFQVDFSQKWSKFTTQKNFSLFWHKS